MMFELTKFNPWLVGCNLIMILVGYLIVFPALKYPHRLSKTRRRGAYCTIVVFCVFAFWGSDFFHVYDNYKELMSSRWTLESVYHIIAQEIAPDNYFLWRLVVWGLPTILIVKTFKRVEINHDLAVCFFLMIWLLWFSYARVSLAMAMVFFGLALVSKSPSSFFSLLFGLSFILSSLFFHKSAGFIVCIAFLALLVPNKWNKKWILLLLCFPLLVYWASTYLSSFLIGDLSSSNDEINSYIERGQDYMNDDSYIEGFGYFLGQLLERVPYYMLCLSSLKILIYKTYSIPNKSVVVFMKVLVLLVTVASVFAFDISINTQLIYERFMRFSFIPSCVLLTYFWTNRIYPKWHKWTFNIAWIGSLYQIVYMLYCSILYKGN